MGRGRRGQGRSIVMRGTFVILCCGVALGGCQSQGTDSRQETEDTPTGPTTAPGASDSVESGEGVPDQRWDPKEWAPTVSISLNRLSDAEREAWRASYLDGLADDLDGPAPEVALERWVEPHAEWDQAISTCMGESGFPVEVDGGSISYPMGVPPDDQLSAWDLAWYTCNARFTPDPDYSQDWTEEQIGLVYDYWDQYFIPCVEEHGIAVNRTQQPSRESYVSTFFAGERNWWPSRYLETLPETQREQVESVCPPLPPPEAMYGT